MNVQEEALVLIALDERNAMAIINDASPNPKDPNVTHAHRKLVNTELSL